MNTTTIKASTELGALAFVPTRAFIETLQVGDFAPNGFGQVRTVQSIAYRGVDVNGAAYVGYYVGYGASGTISHSLKEGQVVRSLRLCQMLNSSEIDALEGYLP
jgi:hypothetical protein